ncbi:MAG: TIGR03435 family protein [Bryobacteraceae bacterium]|jgi:uncharacterized protein (TIGR03435 family)
MIKWAPSKLKETTVTAHRHFRTICASLAVVASIGPAAAQPSSANRVAPRFEVASVKLCPRDLDEGTDGGSIDRGGVSFRCWSLMDYVRLAYGRFGPGQFNAGVIQIEGGPEWIDKERYEIVAKAQGDPGTSTLGGPMMQTLLEERFRLKIHREPRQVPVYALVVSKRGARLPPAKEACFAQGSGKPFPHRQQGQPFPPICGKGRRDVEGFAVHGSTLADFCVALSGVPLKLDRRSFIDTTASPANFDFDLKFPDSSGPQPEPGASAPPPVPQAPGDDAWRLQSALSKLGLKLVPAIGPGEALVIDHAGASRDVARIICISSCNFLF